jgi:hypothetical protein
MHRLCFLFPDVERTRSAVAALHGAGIGDSDIMIVARHDMPLEDLPTANIDKTDAIPGLERGLAGGGVIGALGGLIVMRFTALGVILGGAAIPWFAAIGAGIGGVMTLLAGASFPSSRLRRFEEAIEHQGKILLMADVKNDRIREIEDLLKAQAPDGDFVGFEPRAPVLPP